MKDLLIELGVKIPDLVAGFAGGVVNAFVFQRSTPIAIVGSVVVGALTANYLGEPVAKYLGTGQGVAAFLVGIGGMAFVQGLVKAIKQWRPIAPYGGGNGS